MAITTVSCNAEAPQGQSKNISSPARQRVVSRNSPPKARNPSPKSSKNATNSSSSATHFCSGVLFNSPDPSFLPIPIFDDDVVVNSEKSTTIVNVVNKTDTLRQFLNIRPGLLSTAVIG